MRNVDLHRPWYEFARRVIPQTGRGISVELGSGQGEFLAGGPAGCRRVGVDLAAENARASRDACGRGVVADLERALPFASASVDGIVMIEVIEHIAAAEQLVDEIARVLQPNGWLVLTTPNVAHLTYRVRALTGHPPKQEGYHRRFFTKEPLERILRERGFAVESTASFGKQAALTKLMRWLGRAPKRSKVRYRVWPRFEPLLAQHFVWRVRLRAAGAGLGARPISAPPRRRCRSHTAAGPR